MNSVSSCNCYSKMSVQDIEHTLQAVQNHKTTSPLSFDADFENGTLGRVDRVGIDWYHIILRPDTWYRFFFRVQGCREREIIFEFTCRNNNKPLYDEGKHRWNMRDGIVKPKISYDQKLWEPVDHIEKHPLATGQYTFRHYFTEDSAYLSHHHPYTYSDMLEWLKTLDDHPHVNIETLGPTRNGFPVPFLTIEENPSSKDLIVLIGREDADEITGSWGIEGLVKALLSPEMNDLRQRFTFKIVPMVSIDGVVAGAHYSAGYCYGGWRWHEDPAPQEIENVKNAIRGWGGDGYRLKLAGKLHGTPRFSPRIGYDGILTASQDLQETIEDAVFRYSDGKWPHGNKNLAIRPQGYFERFILDEFGLYNVFGTHIMGDTPASSRQGGEGLMHGIATWLRS